MVALVIVHVQVLSGLKFIPAGTFLLQNKDNKIETNQEAG
jgi:hypothetical protein